MNFTDRLPNVHPGDVIREDFMKPWGMTPYRLAKGIGMSQTAVSEILAGKRGVTATTALRLSAFLGCTPRFWLGLQTAFDLEEAERDEAFRAKLAQLTRYEHAGPLVEEEEEEQEERPAGRAAA
jgi:addiction module HigA family antidote